MTSPEDLQDRQLLTDLIIETSTLIEKHTASFLQDENQDADELQRLRYAIKLFQHKRQQHLQQTLERLQQVHRTSGQIKTPKNNWHVSQ